MKKKLKWAIPFAVLALTCGIAAGCGGGHECSYTEWGYNETQHWKECPEDKKIDEGSKADHVYGEDGKCECGATEPVRDVTITDGTAADANGTITISKTAAKTGDSITVTVAPAEGYQLKALKVNDENVFGAMTGLTYTFTVRDNTTIVAEFEKIASSAISAKITGVKYGAEGNSLAAGTAVKLTSPGKADIETELVAEEGNLYLKVAEIAGANWNIVIEGYAAKEIVVERDATYSADIQIGYDLLQSLVPLWNPGASDSDDLSAQNEGKVVHKSGYYQWLSTNDTYGAVAITADVFAGGTRQGVFLRFEGETYAKDGFAMIQKEGNKKITWNGAGSGYTGTNLFPEQWDTYIEPLAKEDYVLTLVRDGANLAVFIDGELVGFKTLPEGYAEKKCHIGIFCEGAEDIADKERTFSIGTPADFFTTATITNSTEAGEKGTVTLPEGEFTVGDTAEIAIEAEEGYVLGSLTVNGKEYGDRVANGKLTLTVNKSTMDIKAHFIETVFSVTNAECPAGDYNFDSYIINDKLVLGYKRYQGTNSSIISYGELVGDGLNGITRYGDDFNGNNKNIHFIADGTNNADCLFLDNGQYKDVTVTVPKGATQILVFTGTYDGGDKTITCNLYNDGGFCVANGTFLHTRGDNPRADLVTFTVDSSAFGENGETYTLRIGGNCSTTVAAIVVLGEKYEATVTNETAQDANGTLTLDKAKATTGEEVTITLTPNQGYRVKELKVNGVSVIGSVVENEYSFILAKNTTVAAEFEAYNAVTVNAKFTFTKEDGTTVLDLGDELDVTLTHAMGDTQEAKLTKQADGTYALSGTGEDGKLYTGTYKMSVSGGKITYGFLDSVELTIAENMSPISLTRKIAIGNDYGGQNGAKVEVGANISIKGMANDWDEFSSDHGWRNIPEAALTLTEEAKNAKNVQVDFNLKSTGTRRMYINAFGLSMVDGYKGLRMILWEESDGKIAYAPLDGRKLGEQVVSGNPDTYLEVNGWVETLAESDAGVDIRAVRSGSLMRFFAKNAEGKWIQIFTQTCDANAKTDIRFLGNGADFTISNIAFEVRENGDIQGERKIDVSFAENQAHGYKVVVEQTADYFTDNASSAKITILTENAGTAWSWFPNAITVDGEEFDFTKVTRESYGMGACGFVFTVENITKDTEIVVTVAKGEQVGYEATYGDAQTEECGKIQCDMEIEASSTEYYWNDRCEITVTANRGYELAKLVIGEGEGAIEVTSGGSNGWTQNGSVYKYAFRVDGDIKVVATFKVKPETDVTLTFDPINFKGEHVEFANGTEITFTDKNNFTYTYTVGATENFTKMYEGEYTVSCEGYCDTTVTVGVEATELLIHLYEPIATPSANAGSEITVTENQTITIHGNGIADREADRAISADLKLTDEQKNSTGLTLTFTVKGTKKDNRGGDDWAASRFGVQLGEGYLGFFVFARNNSEPTAADIVKLPENSLGMNGQERKWHGDDPALKWLTVAAFSENGLQMKAERKNGVISIYAKNGENWVLLSKDEKSTGNGGTAVENPSSGGDLTIANNVLNEIKFLGGGDHWTFSDIEITLPEASEKATLTTSVNKAEDQEEAWGKIETDVAGYYKGDKAIITVTANKGYELEKLVIGETEVTTGWTKDGLVYTYEYTLTGDTTVVAYIKETPIPQVTPSITVSGAKYGSEEKPEIAAGTKVTLSNADMGTEYVGTVGADGKLTFEKKLYVAEYKVTAEGYFEGTVAVTEDTETEIALTLYSEKVDCEITVGETGETAKYIAEGAKITFSKGEEKKTLTVTNGKVKLENVLTGDWLTSANFGGYDLHLGWTTVDKTGKASVTVDTAGLCWKNEGDDKGHQRDFVSTDINAATIEVITNEAYHNRIMLASSKQGGALAFKFALPESVKAKLNNNEDIKSIVSVPIGMSDGDSVFAIIHIEKVGETKTAEFAYYNNVDDHWFDASKRLNLVDQWDNLVGDGLWVVVDLNKDTGAISTYAGATLGTAVNMQYNRTYKGASKEIVKLQIGNGIEAKADNLLVTFNYGATIQDLNVGGDIQEVNVGFTVKGYEADKTTEADIADGTKIAIIASDNTEKTYTVGSTDPLALKLGDYTAYLNGYEKISFSVTEESTSIALNLIETIAYTDYDNNSVQIDSANGTISITGQGEADRNAHATKNAELVLTEEQKNATDLTLTFTAKSTKRFTQGGDWAAKRIGVQMGDGEIGFFVFFRVKADGYGGEDSADVVKLNSGSLDVNPQDESKWHDGDTALAWMVTAVNGEGLNMKVERKNGVIKIYAQNGENWVELSTGATSDLAIGNDVKNEIRLIGCGDSYQFSNIAVTTTPATPEA